MQRQDHPEAGWLLPGEDEADTQGTEHTETPTESAATHAEVHPSETAHRARLRTSAHATAHCLLGCTVGEAAGLVLGVALGLSVAHTVTLAVSLGFVTGLLLATIPVMADTGLSFGRTLRAVWLGETVAIGVMEIAMNGVDLWLGGIQAMTVFSSLFWLALGAAIPAGFLAAWPVNHWLIGRHVKRCHHAAAPGAAVNPASDDSAS